MRFIVVDWGTSRFRAFKVADGTIVARLSGEEGISTVPPGGHAAIFQRHCGPWLAEDPAAAVMLVGMVGSREGWAVAPYAACPAGPDDVARALIEVDLGGGRPGRIVPGLVAEEAGAVDVMRGEETLTFGAGIADGLVCLPGTHPKWVEVRAGRIARFATFMTGEVYALMRHHSMAGRPATEPADPAGFALGLDAAARNAGARPAGLLNLLFGARAATVTGRLSGAALGPYLSGLLTGDEINGAFARFDVSGTVTIIGAEARAEGYREALARRGVAIRTIDPEAALIAGLTRILGGL